MYSETVLRWASDDRRVGTLVEADGIGEVGLGEQEAGKRLAVRFALQVRSGRLETVRFQVFGCGFTIAACAATADLAEGTLLSDAAAIDPAMVTAVLAGLPPERGYCAELAVEALHAAINSVNLRSPILSSLKSSDDEHCPKISSDDPVYRLLVDSPSLTGSSREDRHLFACLLAIACTEHADIPSALGLNEADTVSLLVLFFPEITLSHLSNLACTTAGSCPQINQELRSLLLAYLPHDPDGWVPTTSYWLAQIIAARAAHPGHLWRAMGLFSRPQLTAAIQRHLPALAEANTQGMRWKRFLFKQLCERGGHVLCKAPNCGVCSDYALCFTAE